MEDEICITAKDDGTVFLGVFDGHGGKEAAIYAKQHLYDNILAQVGFAGSDPEKICSAIRGGFLQTHLDMSRVIDTWPKRKDGFHSTSGTTATIVILRDNRLYVAHVGDSAAVVSCKNDTQYEARELTRDHKPEDLEEKARIESLGGKVVTSNTGVHRVVWKRLSQSLRYEYIPFLAVSRALGDLWSYDEDVDDFIVSPEPDINVVDLEHGVHKFIIVASDGLWGVMNAQTAVGIVSKYEETSLLKAAERNSSKHLLQKSLELWHKRRSRADNISVVVAFLDNVFSDVDINPICVEAPETTLAKTMDLNVKTSFQNNMENSSLQLARQISFPTDEAGVLNTNPSVLVNDINSDSSIHNEVEGEDHSLGKRKNDDNSILNNEKKLKLGLGNQDNLLIT